MKRTVILLLLLTSFLMVKAQKESGTIYREHQAITKTHAMWDAFVKADKATVLSFFADTVAYYINGVGNRVPKESVIGGIDWWKNISNLAIKVDSPASPDAIQYKEGDLWVLDWLRITGTHKESGINVDMPMHDMYHFNKEGKIDGFLQYADASVMEEINNSQRIVENGIVYINHPYIATVRKLINAYCAEDIPGMMTIYDPKARFMSISDKWGKSISLEDKMKGDKETFAYYDQIKLTQVGYPDCLYYAKDDAYVVYSWWKLSCTTKEGKKLSDIPVMLTHSFNKEGKIKWQGLYISDNHFR